MKNILKRLIMISLAAIGFDKASKEMKLTRLIEKFDVLEPVRVPGGIKK